MSGRSETRDAPCRSAKTTLATTENVGRNQFIDRLWERRVDHSTRLLTWVFVVLIFGSALIVVLVDTFIGIGALGCVAGIFVFLRSRNPAKYVKGDLLHERPSQYASISRDLGKVAPGNEYAALAVSMSTERSSEKEKKMEDEEPFAKGMGAGKP